MFTPNTPLFRDPIFDGAADPTVIWNCQERSWWLLYTNRRASAVNHGVSYVHGTDIGIASSNDNGRTWIYRGILEGLNFEFGRNTFWAPEVIYAQGAYHMYVSYVRGIPTDWDCPRAILHYTSENLWDWTFQGKLALSSDRVIDACVYQIAPDSWKLWYKDECNSSHTYGASSTDLYHWDVIGPEIIDCPHEGPNVFRLGGSYWMITDPWCGLGVYRSDDAAHWERRDNILRQGGTRPDDGTIANHADVLVNGSRAYIFYFTHPEVSEAQRNGLEYREYRHRRSSIQVAELTFDRDGLACDRNDVRIFLEPEAE